MPLSNATSGPPPGRADTNETRPNTTRPAWDHLTRGRGAATAAKTSGVTSYHDQNALDSTVTATSDHPAASARLMRPV